MSNQILLQEYSRLTREERRKNMEILRQRASENTEINQNGDIEKDPKRIFTQKQKDQIFQDSKKYNQFDENTMRVDITGRIIIKDLQRIDKVRKTLSGEYEHILNFDNLDCQNYYSISLLLCLFFLQLRFQFYNMPHVFVYYQ